ncbi:hypothetical protein C2I18_15790 [Paenibacillus sp. PK3_47]|uniref:acyltransferase family protein n=1 Tax=Paenibacillus sp. PK3_47 TaxID=2072642 RepID=UPI00201D9EBB|nr:acyltransferase [Paenibacillus sp. PK3_47]UQZ34864.1 hypothetical protein C2I18_15790 [Paenibacillus sp. PK3_47]
MMPNKFQLIQALKAIVAVLILVGHLGAVAAEKLNYTFLPSGIVRTGGVDFFFVLSGFLIYFLYFKNINKGKVSLFLKKRAVRIYPILWIFTLISLPVYFFVASFGGGHETQPGVIIKSLLLYPQSKPVLGATWSLSHVILFYGLFALFLHNPRLTRRIALGWSILITYLWIWPPSLTLPYEIQFLFSPFNLEFLLGCVVAHFALKLKLKYEVFMIAAGVSLFPLAWINNINGYVPVNTTIMYSVASALIILGALSLDSKRTVTIHKWVDKLGDSSYAIIITNLPMIIFITKIFDVLNLHGTIGYVPAILLTGVLTAIGGMLVHMFIEQPVTKYLSSKFIVKKQKVTVVPAKQTA